MSHFLKNSSMSHPAWKLSNLRIDPRLSVFAAEQLVCLRVTNDYFLLAVPSEKSLP